MRPLQVRAFWDAETGVWVAVSADVPGLVAEAPGLDSLKAKLGVLIPELLAAIGRLPVEASVTVTLLAEYREQFTPLDA